MVTQKYSPTSISIFYGLSSDTKPLDCPNGSEFHEIDTGDMYRFDEEGSEWAYAGASEGGGGGSGGGEDNIFVVPFTVSNGTWSAEKTFQETLAAMTSGKLVLANVMSSTVLPASQLNRGFTTIRFSGIRTTSDSGRITEVTFKSDESVTYEDVEIALDGGGSDLNPELVSALGNSWNNGGFGYSDDEVSLSMTTADENGWRPGGSDGIPEGIHYCIISGVDLSALYGSELENYKYSVTASLNGNSFTPTTTAQGDVITCRGRYEEIDLGEYDVEITLITGENMVIFAVPEDYTPIEATLELGITKHHTISENYIPDNGGSGGSGGAYIINLELRSESTTEFTFDKTWQEVADAFMSGKICIAVMNDEYFGKANYMITYTYEDNGAYGLRCGYVNCSVNAPDDYPIFIID